MGKLILSLGEPGTGKSRAILNLDPDTTVLIKPNRKDLPFRGGAIKYNEEKKNTVNCKTFGEIQKILQSINAGTRIKTVVIEDLTHYFSHRVMQDASKKGFEKWSELAVDVFNSIIKIEETLRDDLYVIVIGHTERSSDNMGNTIITLQSPGKLLENQIKIPSYFTYVLHTDVHTKPDGKLEYRFLTNSDGTRLAKSPEGCLESYEPNDYAHVINKIEQYQNGDEIVNSEVATAAN